MAQFVFRALAALIVFTVTTPAFAGGDTDDTGETDTDVGEVVAEATTFASLEAAATAVAALEKAQKAFEERLADCCKGQQSCKKPTPTPTQKAALEKARQRVFERRLAASEAWEGLETGLTQLREELGKASQAWAEWQAQYGPLVLVLRDRLGALERRVDGLEDRVTDLEDRVTDLEDLRLFVGVGMQGAFGGGWGGSESVRNGLSAPIAGWGFGEFQWGGIWRLRVSGGGGFNPLLAERGAGGGLAAGLKMGAGPKAPDLFLTGEVMYMTNPDLSGETLLAVGRRTDIRGGVNILWTKEVHRTRIQTGPHLQLSCGWGEEYTQVVVTPLRRCGVSVGLVVTAALRLTGG